ncbi:MAG: UDP-3-O-(3-hydroxymyristoyl) glucosamine N-acyltransferase [Desulfatitalea sp. BRH_c12]|nr:MAG: UDP-3-O-(3-hydroxymyristoyl) glucosamine N-acyltransferase [Desulfatitalea sp. BRH_c12]
MSISLAHIAQWVNGQIIGDPDCLIEGAGPISSATERQITFAEKGPGLKRVGSCRAAAVIVPRTYTDPALKNGIQVENPRLAFAVVLEKLYPARRPSPGIHPSAVLGEGCQLGKNTSVGAGAVLGDRVVLGDNVILHPLVVIGDDVVIGNDTNIYPHVSVLERCIVGKRVIIHAGTVIGSDGYGFVQDAGRHHKIPQIGIVQIDDDVEIGANNTIDRASFDRTWVQSGVKTDNQVHIAHNVVVGEHTLLVAQVGIAGSTTIGHHAILAGQAGISGHISIGNGAVVGPQTGVGKSVPDKQVVSSGLVAMPHLTWLRLQQVIPNLPDLFKQVRYLENRLAQLEKVSQPAKNPDDKA